MAELLPSNSEIPLDTNNSKAYIGKPKDQSVEINNEEEISNDSKPNTPEKQQQSNLGSDFD